jgi:hypothetical protein
MAGADIENARRRVERAEKRASDRWWDQEALLERERARRAYIRVFEALEGSGQTRMDFEEVDCAR